MNHPDLQHYFNHDLAPEGCHRIITHREAVIEETDAVWDEYYATRSGTRERTEVNRRLRSLKRER